MIVSDDTIKDLYYIFGDLIHELRPSEFDLIAILYDEKGFDSLDEIRSFTYRCINRKKRMY